MKLAKELIRLMSEYYKANKLNERMMYPSYDQYISLISKDILIRTMNAQGYSITTSNIEHIKEVVPKDTITKFELTLKGAVFLYTLEIISWNECKVLLNMNNGEGTKYIKLFRETPDEDIGSYDIIVAMLAVMFGKVSYGAIPGEEPTIPGEEPEEPTIPGEEPEEPTIPGEEPEEPTIPGEEPSIALFYGGGSLNIIIKADLDDLSTFKTSTSSGGINITYSMAVDDTYLYVGGWARTVRKYLKSDLTYIDETPSYGGQINSIAVDDTHIYVGGHAQNVKKYSKSDLTYIDETPSYGGTIRSIAVDDTHIYVGGWTTQTVRKYLKSDLTYIDETPSYGGRINSIAVDDTHIYVGGDTTDTVRKYSKGDLSYIDESANYGNEILTIAVDDTYIYVGGHAQTVRRYLKSNLSYVDQTPSYGGAIRSIAVDDTRIYVGGNTTRTVRRYLKSDLSYVSESDIYGGTIHSIVIG